MGTWTIRALQPAEQRGLHEKAGKIYDWKEILVLDIANRNHAELFRALVDRQRLGRQHPTHTAAVTLTTTTQRELG